VGARYDSMNPEEMKEMAALVQNGRYHYCPNGSHMALWDDQEVYMSGVIGFLTESAR
jgi:proline iminopeptidase